MTVLMSLVALGVVVFVHEMGHLFFAKRVNVSVLEFGVGLGPKLIKKIWGGTEYSVRLFPIGGLVKLSGMTETDTPEIPEEKWFIRQSISARFWTLFGGPLFNVLFGLMLIILLIKLNGVPVFDTVVAQVLPESHASNLLKKGDKILAISGQEVQSPEDIVRWLNLAEGTVEIKWSRLNEIFVEQISLIQKNGKKRIGILFKPKPKPEEISVLRAAHHGVLQTGYIIKMIGVGLIDLIVGNVPMKELSGPVGIIQVTSLSLQKGYMSFLNIVAIISISLGVFNLIPIPLLDGGHIALLGLEAIRGKKILQKTELKLGKVAILILFTLMIFGLFNDILNWKDRMKSFENVEQKRIEND